MTSPSPEPASTDPVYTKRALATVEAFLQASNSPEYTRNVWLYLKKCLQELSRTQSTPTPPANYEILKRLIAIEKKLSDPQVYQQKPATYVDSTCLAPPQGAHEKQVPSRALKGVTVRVIVEAKPSETSEKLVESINAVCSSKSGKDLATRRLQSRDILITADSHDTKNLI
jgi:hypothetical protein